MLKRHLLTALVGAGAFVVSFVLKLVVGDATSGPSFYIGGILFYTTFYLTPLIFLVGAISSLALVVKSAKAKRTGGSEHPDDED